ncbi:hypothetical protein [Bathymodiolus japonicus methanotrophic gill symbiont]|uniref:hypothetical protein n=1 Tax=Bathymodiolus japonicus methanotrophic gill symbiont TaxID=113269 RepID=UPI001C8EC4D1|nr:hypothetical protein [Bathymodiolus japonicus methanotrophic gill symbiont]
MSVFTVGEGLEVQISEENFIPDSCLTPLWSYMMITLPEKDADKLKKRRSISLLCDFVRSHIAVGLEIGITFPNFRNDADIKNIFGAWVLNI